MRGESEGGREGRERGVEGEGSDGKRVGRVRRGVREGKRRGWKGEGWERGGEGGNETNWSVGDRPVTCLLTHQSINPMPKRG